MIALTVFSAPAQAFAWGNGRSRSGNGFGTHDWVLTEANRMAATQGATWVNGSVALRVTDDPDTILRDTRDHVYDRWGRASGHADRKVATYYRRAVSSLAAGDVDAASRALGLLSHYYADVNNPLNTDNARGRVAYALALRRGRRRAPQRDRQEPRVGERTTATRT